MTRDEPFDIPAEPLTAAERAALYHVHDWTTCWDNDNGYLVCPYETSPSVAAWSLAWATVTPSRRSRLVAWLRRVIG